MSNHLKKHSTLTAQSLQQLKRDIILIPLGYPWTLSPPVFFFVNSSNPLVALALCCDHKHLYQLLVEITCHMRRVKAKHNLFSSFLFLFFSFEKIEGMEHLILMRTFWGLWSAF